MPTDAHEVLGFVCTMVLLTECQAAISHPFHNSIASSLQRGEVTEIVVRHQPKAPKATKKVTLGKPDVFPAPFGIGSQIERCPLIQWAKADSSQFAVS